MIETAAANIFLATGEGVSWFPQEYSHLFFEIKGVFAIFAVMLVIYHMNQTWTQVVSRGSKGQRFRYYALLALLVLTAGSTVEQVKNATPVYYYNMGVFITLTLTVIAMIYSIREDRRIRRHDKA